MRILTVQQPWAHAIIFGGKRVENRTRNLAGDYRGPVLIHAGKQRDDRGWVEYGAYALTNTMNQGNPDAAGVIIGVVDLLDVHVGGSPDGCPSSRTPGPWLCSPWAEDGTHHLVLANPRALDEPIPYTGALGLRKTDFGIEGEWLVEYHAPCKYPCAGAEYGCPPSCHMEPVARLVATS